MKTNFWKTWTSLIFVSIGFLLAGCGSPPVNWESRIGNYTYAQAETEFGKPAQTTTLDNGGIFAEWVTARNVRNPAPNGMQTGPVAGGIEQPVNQAAQQTKTE